MIPHEYIEELTRRTDIVELVGGYVQLKRKGRLYGGLCPFHSEKTPSFYVYPDTQSFYCFGCGAGGDAVTLTKKINSIDYVEAVKLLAQRAGMPEPTEDDKTGRLRSQYDLKQDAQRLEYVKEAVEMLAQRSNPTEQEVYAGRLAEETNISKTAIMAQLADAVKKAGSWRRREQNRARLKEGEMDQIKVPYGAGRGALGMASAEQRLLAAMLREPGYIDKVSAQLRPEQFLQPQQKELYEAMLRCREQGVEVSLATLRAFVSEEALNELSRLAAQYSDVNCTPEDIKLYLERIARGTPVASRAASMSTNDIEQYLQSMREQKQGTADAEDSV